MRHVFNEIVRLYFPRWRDSRNWKVRRGSYAPGSQSGRDCSCQSHLKAIYMDKVAEDDPEFIAILIHEICHAITTSTHNSKWLKRMKLAEERASALGDKTVFAQLEKQLQEIESAQNCETRKYLYERAQEIMMDCPNYSLSKLKRALANELRTRPQDLKASDRKLRGIVYVAHLRRDKRRAQPRL